MADRVTTVQSGELSPFHVEGICNQLGIYRADLWAKGPARNALPRWRR
jgi:hypothetical protein